MKPEQLTDILVKTIGARKEGSVYGFPAESEVTLFVALAGETLTIPRVVRVELEAALLHADTARGERYVFTADDVRALKLDRGETGRRDRSAGFGK